MSTVEMDSFAVAETAVRVAPARRRSAAVATMQCLVVSASPQRRDMLSRSAHAAGWEAIVCIDSESARVELHRQVVQLALVDLESGSGQSPPGFRELCERVASLGGPLLTVCGHEGNFEEEIWARQVGAWLYLPGVAIGDDLSQLCQEAKTVVNHLQESKKMSFAG